MYCKLFANQTKLLCYIYLHQFTCLFAWLQNGEFYLCAICLKYARCKTHAHARAHTADDVTICSAEVASLVADAGGGGETGEEEEKSRQGKEEV